MVLTAFITTVAMAAGVTYLLTRNQGSAITSPPAHPADSPTAVPPAAPTAKPCSSPPILVAESVHLESTGLAISATIASSCSGEDVVSNSGMQVNLVDGARDVAAGTFDMSADPVAISPGQQVSRTFVFPAGMYWLTPDLLSQRPTMTAYYTEPSAPDSASGSTGTINLTAKKAALPLSGSPESAALVGLHALVDSDRPVIRGFQHWWLPQVSSKRPGLVAEGITWTNADILRDHLALRQRFPQARLAWSGDWTTFSSPNWWVTVVGLPMTTPHGANGWCDSQGFDANSCFAKMISSSLGVEGTTVYRK